MAIQSRNNQKHKMVDGFHLFHNFCSTNECKYVPMWEHGTRFICQNCPNLLEASGGYVARGDHHTMQVGSCECNIRQDCFPCDSVNKDSRYLAIMDIDLNEEPIQHEETSHQEETSRQMVVKKSSMSFLKPRKSKLSKRSSKSTTSRPNSTKKAPSNIKRDQRRHKIVFEKGGIPEGTKLFYKSKGMTLQKGTVKKGAIYCDCCSEVVSPSKFEDHAGMKSRKKPYDNIFLPNGVSLRQYASSLSKNFAKRTKINSSVWCIGCRKGGDLSICGGFPRPLYECIPFKKRFCEHCKSSMKSVEPKGNALAWKSTTNPRFQSANSPNKDKLVACALCRTYDFTEDGFDDRTVIVCDQCEREYHIGCLNDRRSDQLMELPSGDWFCTEACKHLHSDLNFLLTRGPEKVPDSLMELVKKKLKDSDTENITNLKWIIIRGKGASAEDTLLLTEAVQIFNDCFNPIIDSVTKKDYIPSMAYGMKMGDSDFSGVYSAMLTLDSKVVTAGMFRFLGREIAELPIVATSKAYQEKGYFQLFFTCFEKLLSYYKIGKIVLPAAENAKAMWASKFDFNNVNRKQLRKYRETYTSMVYFLETTLMEKKVPKGQTTAKPGVSFTLNIE